MDDPNKTKMLVPEIHEEKMTALVRLDWGLTFRSSIKSGGLGTFQGLFSVPRFQVSAVKSPGINYTLADRLYPPMCGPILTLA